MTETDPRDPDFDPDQTVNPDDPDGEGTDPTPEPTEDSPPE